MSEEVQKKQRDELVKRVQAVFDTDAVQGRLTQVLAVLLNSAQVEVGRAVLVALVQHEASVKQDKDVEWARLMASMVTDNPDVEVPTNPHNLRNWIVAKLTARERELSKTDLQKGFRDGFLTARERFTKFGWAGNEAGKSLEETLAGVKKEQP